MKKLSLLLPVFFVPMLMQAQEIPQLKQLAAQQLARSHKNAFSADLITRLQKVAPQECIDLALIKARNIDFTQFAHNRIDGEGSYFGTIISPDGMIFTSPHGMSINLYSTTLKKQIGTLNGHADEVTDCLFLDDYTLISSSRDQTVKMWDLKKHITISNLQNPAPVKGIKLAHTDECTILSAFLENGSICVWNLKTHELIHTIEAQYDVSDLFYDKVFNAQKTKVICIEPDNSLIIVDLVKASVLKTESLHEFNILAAVLSPDEKFIATASSDHTIKITNLETAAVVQTLNGHTDAVSTIIYGNNEIISGSKDGTIKRWNVATGLCLISMLAEQDNTVGLYYSEKGKKIISASDNGCIRIWDRVRGDCLKKFQAHSSALHYVKLLTPDCLLTASFTDGTMKVWSMPQGTCHFCKFITDRKPTIGNVHQTKVKVSSDKQSIVIVDNNKISMVQPTENKKQSSWINVVALLAPAGVITAAVVGAFVNLVSHYRS